MHFHFAGTATVAITDGTDNLLLGMLKPPYNTFPPEIIYTHILILSQYLLNGGDIFSLKEIWGHSSLEIVYRYLHSTKAQIITRRREFSLMDRIMGNLKNPHKPKT
jgi:hypothetical protein